MKYRYVQCLLQREHHPDIGGYVATVAWIPEHLAKKGGTVEIKTQHGWEPNWEIHEVYGKIRMAEDQLNEYARDYKHQRKASDI